MLVSPAECPLPTKPGHMVTPERHSGGEAGMNFSADIGVRHKIDALVVLGVVLSVISGLLANRSLGRTAAAADHLYHGNLSSLTALAELQAVTIQTRVDLANLLVSLTETDATA
jgi:hypothetical protein